MNSFPAHPPLRESFRALHRRSAASGRGFVCVLDLRRTRPGMESCPPERTFVRLALLALVIFFVSVRVPKHPVPALQLEGDAMQLASWESPTGFLLQADFPITQPD